MKRSYLYLSEFHVGDKFTTLSRTVTETDVVLFAGITGDNNPIHTDKIYAESLPFNIQNVKIVKDVVSVPVIGAGRMNDPALMLSALRTGAMDFVALGRESVCDPHLPEKIKEGRLDEILTCTGCMQRCLYPNSFEEGFGIFLYDQSI